MSRHKWRLRSIGLAFGLGLCAWVIWDAVRKSQSLDWPEIPWPQVGLTFALVMIAHGLHGLAWVVGARKIAPALGWWDGVGIYSLSFLGRYLPGKIWQVGGISVLARGRGADAIQIAGYSLAFLVAFQVVGALLLLLAYMLDDRPHGWIACVIAAPVISIVLAALYRSLAAPVVAVLPYRFQDKLSGAMDQPFVALALNLFLLALVWILFGTCGYALAKGFAPDWAGSWTQAAAATLGGLIAGFLVLIAPSGAGVRESTISVWLTSVGIAPIAAIALALALRLAMTVGELIWAAVGAALVIRPTPPPHPKH